MILSVLPPPFLLPFIASFKLVCRSMEKKNQEEIQCPSLLPLPSPQSMLESEGKERTEREARRRRRRQTAN